MTKIRKNIAIAVDFDGTCVTHDFPNVGMEIGAAPVLRYLQKEHGCRIILNTMRSHPRKNGISDTLSGKKIERDTLQEAIDWFEKNDIELYGVNKHPTQERWTDSPKCYANIYIDDAALGAPLIHDYSKVVGSFINWYKLVDMFVDDFEASDKLHKKITKDIKKIREAWEVWKLTQGN